MSTRLEVAMSKLEEAVEKSVVEGVREFIREGGHLICGKEPTRKRLTLYTNLDDFEHVGQLIDVEKILYRELKEGADRENIEFWIARLKHMIGRCENTLRKLPQ